jgi:phosphonate degradation associated HDIG domain protein
MSTDTPSRQDALAFVTDIFARRGAGAYLGEAVTMSQHMLQCAHLAERAGAGDALIAAALLHDIGHFADEFAERMALEIDNRHEHAGAVLLAPRFPALVVDCVRHHVAAKRWLCATDPGYFAQLSPASVRTLELQGGPMDAAEAERFAALSHRDAIVRVRRWDDAAKDPAVAAPDFAHYVPCLERVLDLGPG